MERQYRGLGIVAAFTLTIAVAFAVITLIILQQSLDVARQYAEGTSSLYADELVNVLPDRIIETNGMSAVYFDADGTVVKATNDAAKEGENVFETFPAIEGLRDKTAGDGDAQLILWVGIDGLIPHEQCLYEVRSISGGRLLVVNPAHEAFDAMRGRTVAIVLALSVVMVLLLLLVMGIVRWYRARLIRVTTTDELTGLANRKAFSASYESMIEGSTPGNMTLALIDVDKFKQINDTFGHASGDIALASVAAEIQTTVGREGLAGRWGGDEFIGVLCGDPEQAASSLDDMIHRIAALEFEDGMRVSVSVGSTVVNPELTLQGVVDQADDALYVSKEGGRGFLSRYQPGVTPHMSHDGDSDKVAKKRKVVARPLSVLPLKEDSSPVTSSPRGRRMIDLLVHGLLEAVYRMVPFVAGGGILIAIAFLIDGASVDYATLSAEQRASFGTITPLASGLHEVGLAAFNFMLPIFGAFLAQRCAGDEAFMAGFAGGFLASQSSAGFLGAILASLVAALVVHLMRGLVSDSAPFIRRIAPVTLYPLFSLLIMYVLMVLIIDPAASAFDTWLTSLLQMLAEKNHVALGAICGTMMAADLGGPINKAAYHLGTASIAAGSPDIMAAVMVGGMVPPCGIALSMLFFRQFYTDAEKDQSVATLFMGLSFITEGAIPFAITDPLRVLPSCMAGSAVAGAWSVAFGCTSMAPHGGIFVLPVIGHPGMYVLSLIVGSLVTALLLGLLKCSPDTKFGPRN